MRINKKTYQKMPNEIKQHFKRLPNVSKQEATKEMGDKSRYFYCAKASKKERNKGDIDNDHPTVKPLALIEYLVELTKMPNEDQIYLDPYVGSGTTAMAVKKHDRNYIGIEQNEEYCEIARARIDAVQQKLV